MVPTSSASLRALLVAAGYQFVFRASGMIECLVHREAERWLGQGDGEDAALEDAVAQMLPSHIARELLARTIARAVPLVDGAPAMLGALVPEMVVPMAEAEPAEAHLGDHPPDDEVPVSLKETLATLDAILNDITQQLGTVARLAPDRQRLFMLIWIARARSLQELLPREDEVQRRAGAVARRLTEIARIFWPGSVRALQLATRPGDLPELRGRGVPSPQTWAEAVELAERLLDDQLAVADELGLDSDGWAAEPPGAVIDVDPEKAFALAASAIDSVIASTSDEGQLPQPDGAALETLVGAARRLRRVRSRVRDGVAWGTTAGRLRRLLSSLGSRGARVREALDPQARPEHRAM